MNSKILERVFAETKFMFSDIFVVRVERVANFLKQCEQHVCNT